MIEEPYIPNSYTRSYYSVAQNQPINAFSGAVCITVGANTKTSPYTSYERFAGVVITAIPPGVWTPLTDTFLSLFFKYSRSKS